MKNWDKTQTKVKNIKKMELDLRRASCILDSVQEARSEDAEKVVGIMDTLEENCDLLNEMAEDIFTEDFLSVVVKKLDYIAELLRDLKYRSQYFERRAGWHLSIKSPVIFGQELKFKKSVLEKMAELDLYYPLEIIKIKKGKERLLNLVPFVELAGWLENTGKICMEELIGTPANLTEFIPVDEFVKDKHDMEEIIDELDLTIDTLEDVRDLGQWIENYILKAEEKEKEKINIATEDIIKKIKKDVLNKEDLMATLDFLSNKLKK